MPGCILGEHPSSNTYPLTSDCVVHSDISNDVLEAQILEDESVRDFSINRTCLKQLDEINRAIGLVSRSFLPGELSGRDDFLARLQSCESRPAYSLVGVNFRNPNNEIRLAVCVPVLCKLKEAKSIRLSTVITRFGIMKGILELGSAMLTQSGDRRFEFVDLMIPPRAKVWHVYKSSDTSSLIWAKNRQLVGQVRWLRFGELPRRLDCGLGGQHAIRRTVPRHDELMSDCEMLRLRKPSPLVRSPKTFQFRRTFNRSAGWIMKKPMYYVVLPSAPQEFLNRNAVRSSWANWKQRHQRLWSYDFFIGFASITDKALLTKLVDEEHVFGDIVLIDMVDSYKNLTLKMVHAFYYAYHFVQPYYMVRMNSNNRLQAGRLFHFLSGLDDKDVAKAYPKGFMWANRHCIQVNVISELSCHTLPLKLDHSLLVDDSVLPYPGGNFLVDSVALSRMMKIYQDIANQGSVLLAGLCEDCFNGYLATAAGVPILDFSPDRQRLHVGGNCSQGFVLVDETPDELAKSLPGCW